MKTETRMIQIDDSVLFCFAKINEENKVVNLDIDVRNIKTGEHYNGKTTGNQKTFAAQ